MIKTNETAIDGLFGSKTRVKLLHLFLNNPDRAFYVREITRLIDEQINSVRRELANMVKVGIITSDTSDNKLYYQVNDQYAHFVPFRAIFAPDFNVAPTIDGIKRKPTARGNAPAILASCKPVRVAIMSGILVQGSTSQVDLVVVGDLSSKVTALLIKKLETDAGRELTYTVMNYDEFYYRLSVRDKFISDILESKHIVAVDADNILKT